MIKHQFVWPDVVLLRGVELDDPLCESCGREYARHAEIEGITAEDEQFDYGDSISDIANRYRNYEDM